MKHLFTWLIVLLIAGSSHAQTKGDTYVFSPAVVKAVLSDAAVKKGPKISSATILTIPEGVEAQLLQKEGEFYKVLVDSTYGYVHYVFFDESYQTFSSRHYPLKLVDSNTGANLDPDIWYGRTTEMATVLEKPYAVATTLTTLEKGTIIRVKAHNQNYYQVEMNGKVGYIAPHHIANVARNQADLVQPPTQTQPLSSAGTSSSNTSTMYSTPTTGATIYTGPRGGRYYYNSHGNKTYIRRK